MIAFALHASQSWMITGIHQGYFPVDSCYIWCSHEQIVTQIDIFLLPTVLRTYIRLGALVRFQNYPNDL